MLAARSVTQLIEELMRLPGVGEKTAQRLAFHLLKVPKQEAEALALSILAVKEKIRRCSQCYRHHGGGAVPDLHRSQA